MDTASWDSMVQGVQEAFIKESPPKGKLKESSGNIGYEDTVTANSEEMLAKASEIFDTVLRDELEKEKSKNRELSTRLTEKEKQLKIAERQTESMKRHMVLSQVIKGRFLLKKWGHTHPPLNVGTPCLGNKLWFILHFRTIRSFLIFTKMFTF